jgi:hypothetical protein
MPERDGFLLDETLDEDGELAEPGFDIMDVNVNGVLRSNSLHFFEARLDFNIRSCQIGISPLCKESRTRWLACYDRLSRIVSSIE